MVRTAWMMKLKPGNEAIYKRKHDEIWPEMLENMKRDGVRTFSIYRNGLDLFAYHGARQRPATPTASRVTPPGAGGMERRPLGNQPRFLAGAIPGSRRCSTFRKSLRATPRVFAIRGRSRHPRHPVPPRRSIDEEEPREPDRVQHRRRRATALALRWAVRCSSSTKPSAPRSPARGPVGEPPRPDVIISSGARRHRSRRVLFRGGRGGRRRRADGHSASSFMPAGAEEDLLDYYAPSTRRSASRSSCRTCRRAGPAPALALRIADACRNVKYIRSRDPAPLTSEFRSLAPRRLASG